MESILYGKAPAQKYFVNRQNIIANQFKKMLFNMADIRTR
jgi:hypothetical protein